MLIQRYKPYNDAVLERFGEHTKKNSWDFTWYIGKDKIGITSNQSTEANMFMQGLLRSHDELLLQPTHNTISRGDSSFARMATLTSGDEVKDLIDLIRKNSTVHMYVASLDLDLDRILVDKVLVFSPFAPLSQFYAQITIMSVSVL